MITTNRTTRGTLITILNYSEYQDIIQETDTSGTTSSATDTATNAHRIDYLVESELLDGDVNVRPIPIRQIFN